MGSNYNSTEQTFIDRFNKEKILYQIWGEYIKQVLLEDSYICSLLKMPVEVRVKGLESLITKAFYRNKGYENPYEDITDKVGVRFVVLLSEHISSICIKLEACKDWDYSQDRHFEKEREESPNIFTYQSVHYILTCKHNLPYNGTIIPKGTTCEVQIRTLLQHSYSELTHDTVYKCNTAADPLIHRKIARSMALIEATEELFSDVTNSLFQKSNIIDTYIDELDGLYLEIIPNRNLSHNLNIFILDSYLDWLSTDNLCLVTYYIKENMPILEDCIKENYSKNKLFQQPIILLLFYLLENYKHQLTLAWPLPIDQLEIIANSIGESVKNL